MPGGPGDPKKQAGRPVPPSRAKAGEIDLELPDVDSAGAFEIEQAGESRVIGTPLEQAVRAPAPAPPSAAAPAPAVLVAGVPPIVAGTLPPEAASPPGAKQFAGLVGSALRAFASDLHLHPGHPLTIRQHGRVTYGNGAPLAPDPLEAAIFELLDDAERVQLSSSGEVETTFLAPGGARCRLHVYRQAAGVSVVLRVVPVTPPALSHLGLPPALAPLVRAQGGLVLLTGPRGSGKTWTLAALVDLLNTERQDHVVCIERPIEFVHTSRRCVVSQREIPTHAASVARAVRAALNEDPDVLVIGEIEDRETARLALQAAESGRLVLATFPASSAVRAVSRFAGLFPSDQHGLVGAMLAGALRAVVGQRLVTTSDRQRRAPVCEVIEVGQAASSLLSQGRWRELKPAISLDQALANAVRTGTITREEARLHAEFPEAIG